MNGNLASRLSMPVLGTLALLLLPLAHSALAERDEFFSDDFNGSALDPNKWETRIATAGIRYEEGRWTLPPVEANYGSVTVANSHLTLDNPSPTLSCPMFPLVWTNKAIPSAGDFELKFRMRYTAGGYWGDGVRIVTMPSPFEPALGSTESAKGQYVLMIHQDNVDCKGPQISLLGRPGDGSPSLPFNTEWHTYKLRYEGGSSTLYVDGVFLAGPLPTPRPNCIQLGVGEVGCCGDSCSSSGCRWTSYSLDYIEVKTIGETSAGASSWGRLKARYR